MWESDYSITKLFDNRTITIYNKEIPSVVVKLKAPSIRQQLNDFGLLKLLSTVENDKVKIFKESFPKLKIENSLDLINNLVANPIFTNSKEFKGMSSELLGTLKTYISDVEIDASRMLKIDKYVVDTEL